MTDTSSTSRTNQHHEMGRLDWRWRLGSSSAKEHNVHSVFLWKCIDWMRDAGVDSNDNTSWRDSQPQQSADLWRSLPHGPIITQDSVNLIILEVMESLRGEYNLFTEINKASESKTRNFLKASSMTLSFSWFHSRQLEQRGTARIPSSTSSNGLFSTIRRDFPFRLLLSVGPLHSKFPIAHKWFYSSSSISFSTIVSVHHEKFSIRLWLSIMKISLTIGQSINIIIRLFWTGKSLSIRAWINLIDILLTSSFYNLSYQSYFRSKSFT